MELGGTVQKNHYSRYMKSEIISFTKSAGVWGKSVFLDCSTQGWALLLLQVLECCGCFPISLNDKGRGYPMLLCLN